MRALLGRCLLLGAGAGVVLGAVGAWANVLAPERYLASELPWLALEALSRGMLRGVVLGGVVGVLAALPLVPHSRRPAMPARARVSASLSGGLTALASVAWLRASGPELERPSGVLAWGLAGLVGASLGLLAGRRWALVSAALALLASIAVAALTALRPSPSGPNLLLLSIDTLRADRLGCYGSATARTPHLDALAREGVLWETVVASAPVTLPAMSTVMTGMDPPQHGVHYNGFYQLPRAAVTLGEVLAERGYRTAAAVGNFALDARFRIDQGFATYDDRMTQRMNPHPPSARPEGAGAGRNWWEEHLTEEPAQRFANEITDAGLAWLAEQGEEPFFLWLHYMDPHAPYLPPKDYRGRGAYEGEVAFVDAEIGRLLAGYEERFPGRDTLVVVIGDHGESLGEHGVTGHVFALFEQMLCVPFLMHRQGTLEPGRRVTAPLRGRDVRAEILRALGLSPAAPTPDSGSEWWAYSETYQPLINESGQPLRALRGERWKLVQQEEGVQALYDLAHDPGEETNLVHERVDEAARLQALLQELAGPTEAGTLSADAETLERLRALGYVR